MRTRAFLSAMLAGLAVLASCSFAGAATGSGCSSAPSTPTAPSSTDSASTQADAGTAGGSVTITQGGVYTGNWSSPSADRAAVTIDTDQPVVLCGCHLFGAADLVQTVHPHTKITIENCRATGVVTPGTTAGRFLDAEGFDSVTVRNNDIEGTGGIYLLQYAGSDPADTVRIEHNQARNIGGGRSADGGSAVSDTGVVQFLQLDKVEAVPQVEVSWNEVVNSAGRSRVEDVINVFSSQGTPSSPIRIHDNYIDGAYPLDPERDAAYTGGGIIVDGDTRSAWVSITGNTVLRTTNHGVAVAAGHDNLVSGNTVVASGWTDDGRIAAGQNVGGYVWNRAQAPGFDRNVMRDNVFGWWVPSRSARNDWWLPDCSEGCTGNTSIRPGSVITADDEAVARRAWQDAAVAQQIQVGPP